MRRLHAGSGNSGVTWVLVSIAASYLLQPAYTQNTDIGRPWFTVVGSEYIRDNQVYACAVTVYPYNDLPTRVTVEIINPSGGESDYIKYNQTVLVEPSVTETVELQIGEVNHGYLLSVHGEGGMKFFDQKELKYDSMWNNVHVQTDKSIYRRGEKVRFRVISLSHDLKPKDYRGMQIFVYDESWALAKQWSSVDTKGGVWSGEFYLSRALPGNWSIFVKFEANDKNGGDDIFKVFQVAEFDLPKFQVTVNVPQHHLNNGSKIPVQVVARYTHGGPVRGKVSIYMTETANLGYLLGTNLLFNGETTSNFEPLPGNGPVYYLRFFVTVEEARTRTKEKAEGFSTVYKDPYRMEFIKKSSSFKPGIKQYVTLKVTRFDGSPVGDSGEPVSIFTKQMIHDVLEEDGEKLFQVPSSGFLQIPFFPHREAANVTIEAMYKGAQNESFSFLHKAESPSSNYIEAKLTTSFPQVNSKVEVSVTMTEHSPLVLYQVFGIKGLLLAGSAPVNPGKTSTTIEFVVSPSMAPISTLLVNYVRPNKEIVVDFVYICAEYNFSNFVKLESNVTVSVPGGGIAFNISTKPNSYVGLLGVDQSQLHLQGGYDLDKERLIGALKELNSNNYHMLLEEETKLSAKLVFESTGALVLTNGVVFKGLRPDQPTVDPPIIMPTSSQREIRYNFPETWIWRELKTDERGVAVFNETIPDTPTSWVISAFSLDSTFGIGLMDQPVKIQVFRPFFIELDLPISVNKCEAVTLPVTVYNYLSEEVTAEVTLFNTAQQFVFRNVNNLLSSSSGNQDFRTERVTVKPNSGVKTSFTVAAIELGFISINVTAKCALAEDTVETKVLVKVGDICQADEVMETTRDIKVPQEWVRTMVDTLEKELIAKDKAMLDEDLGSDAAALNNKLTNMTKTLWGRMFQAKDSDRLVNDILLYIGNTSLFNERYESDFSYNSFYCNELSDFAKHLIEFQSLQESNPRTIKYYSRNVLISALDVCLNKMDNTTDEHVCNEETKDLIIHRFKALESIRIDLNNKFRRGMETAASGVKTCFTLINTDDIRNVLVSLFFIIY